MGCTSSKDAGVESKDGPSEPRPEPTFGKDPKLKLDDFMAQNLKDEIIIRKPGQINGQQFIIDKCVGCRIYLFDHVAQVIIDHCEDCDIFIGPCEDDVFIRNSDECRVVVACRQFRVYNCKQLRCQLYTATQPVIESSTDFRVGCYQSFYDDLPAHFCKAGLSVWDNKWSEVYDFSQHDGPKAWKSLTEAQQATGLVVPPPQELVDEVQYVIPDRLSSLVPITFGVERSLPEKAEGVFVLLSPTAGLKALALLRAIMKAAAPGDASAGSRPLPSGSPSSQGQNDVELVFGKPQTGSGGSGGSGGGGGGGAMPPCAPGADLPDDENSDAETAAASASSAAVHTIRTRQFRITKEQVKALMGGKRKVVDAMCSVKKNSPDVCIAMHLAGTAAIRPIFTTLAPSLATTPEHVWLAPADQTERAVHLVFEEWKIKA